MVIFGVTGDLARKKLLPAIYDLANRGLLPAGFALVGYGRRDWSKQDFEDYVCKAVKAGARTEFRENVWKRLAEGMHFVTGNFDDDAAFDQLENTLTSLDRERGTGGNWAFYLSVPPDYFADVCHQLQRSGMAQPGPGSWRRVIIEKPFGHDLDSAHELNRLVNSVFPEDAVFRIDHYLGKETVQNIMALRFANQLFDPLWNAHYIDHVQITMSEDIGLGGRAGYYDGIGAARDVIQNHLLQLLALVAMEEPVSFNPQELQTEKVKVLRSTTPVYPLSKTTARGQYTAGWQGSEYVKGLREEEGFDAESNTETYAACTLEVTPAAGLECRSTCALVNALGVVSRKLPWCLNEPRTNLLVTRLLPSWGKMLWLFGYSQTKASSCVLVRRSLVPPWKFATSTWTFPTLRLLPRNHPKRTNASFWTYYLGNPVCSPPTKRWSSAGRFSTRSWSTGLTMAALMITRRVPGVRPVPTRCWAARAVRGDAPS